MNSLFISDLMILIPEANFRRRLYRLDRVHTYSLAYVMECVKAYRMRSVALDLDTELVYCFSHRRMHVRLEL